MCMFRSCVQEQAPGSSMEPFEVEASGEQRLSSTLASMQRQLTTPTQTAQQWYILISPRPPILLSYQIFRGRHVACAKGLSVPATVALSDAYPDIILRREAECIVEVGPCNQAAWPRNVPIGGICFKVAVWAPKELLRIADAPVAGCVVCLLSHACKLLVVSTPHISA